MKFPYRKLQKSIKRWQVCSKSYQKETDKIKYTTDLNQDESQILGFYSENPKLLFVNQFDSDAVIPHPLYDAQTHSNDIVLFRVGRFGYNGYKPIKFSSKIQPVCIPSNFEEDDVVNNNHGHGTNGEFFNPDDSATQNTYECFVAGYGATDDDGSNENELLRSAKVPLVSTSQCKQEIEESSEGSWSTSTLCGGSSSGGKRANQGDFGGPLVCIKNSTDSEQHMQKAWVQVGVTSWGPKGNLNQVSGVYTRVSHYTDWIWGEIERVGLTLCGGCYGAEIKGQSCCNTCQEVIDAYKKVGWAYDTNLFVHCNPGKWF